MSYYPRFAHLLELYLDAADRSAAWLAQRINVNPGTVTRWRNGESRPSKPETVVRIADSLGVTAEDKRREFLGAAGYAHIEGKQSQSHFQQTVSELRMGSHLSFNFELNEAVLVATLGAEPQVIAIAAQLLQQQGEPVSTVVALHTQATHRPISQTLPALQKAFDEHPEWPEFRAHPVPAGDTLTPEQIELFARELYGVLKMWVMKEARVHLLLAGGRKSMAMVGVTVAQLLLGTDDRLWYLHSDDELRFSGRFHLEPQDKAHLIQVPLPQLRPAPAIYTQPFQAETPDAAFEALEVEQSRQLQRFVDQELTAAERKLAALVVQEVVTVAKMAEQLNKKPKTVTNQLNSIYSKLESAFGLQPDKGIKREFLRKQLKGFL